MKSILYLAEFQQVGNFIFEKVLYFKNTCFLWSIILLTLISLVIEIFQ